MVLLARGRYERFWGPMLHTAITQKFPNQFRFLRYEKASSESVPFKSAIIWKFCYKNAFKDFKSNLN